MKFQDYLTEARLAPLYHSTSMNYAINIVDDDRIKAQNAHGGHSQIVKGYNNDKHGHMRYSGYVKPTVSLTRDKKTAFNYRWQNSVVFELDQLKLSQTHKIEPINIETYWDSFDKAHAKSDYLREEYVTKDIYPLEKYLTKIIIPNMTYILSNYDTMILINSKLYKHPKLYDLQRKKFINA